MKRSADRRRRRATPPAVLFRAAAGPRRGFGHLVRCRSLARALDITPVVSLRATADTARHAAALGCTVVEGGPRHVLAHTPWDVLVVDDPNRAAAAAWIRAGRRAGRPVVTVHDLGLGCLEGDLVVDGSVVRKPALRRAAGALVAGPRYAVLDPRLMSWRRRGAEPAGACSVLIALGGGTNVTLASAIADALTAADERIQVRIAGGFSAGGHAQLRVQPRVCWLGRTPGLGRELARADVAVVGGGVTLYEACALGVPTVAVPVVDAQRETIAAFVRKGAATGIVDGPLNLDRVVELVIALVEDRRKRRGLAERASALVDGRGAARVAQFVTRLATAH